MKQSPAIAILTLVALPLIWLWPCVIGERTFVPYDVNQFPPTSVTSTKSELEQARDGANFDVTELPVWFVPELKLARDELMNGRLPTWNPHARGGAPLHAHGLIGLCYPPNWIALFADKPESKLGLIAWCNLALGGLLAFGLLRQVGLGVLCAWFGAALFELSGPMAANSFFWMRLASFVWLPGVLWAILCIAQADRVRPLATLGLGAAFAMTWLGGFPPFAATTTLFAGFLFIWLTAERLVTQGSKPALRVATRLLFGLLLGALWAMPQVLPSLAFFPESARPPTPLWSDISGQAFEPYGLLGYLMPTVFGDPTLASTLPYQNSPMQLLLNTRSLDDASAALPNYNFTEYSVFVSSLGFVLAIIGLTTARRRRAWFIRFALLFALGLGLFWPGLQLLFHLPIVENAWPMRWPSAATLFVAWAAALGLDGLLTRKKTAALVAGSLSVVAALLMWWCTSWPAERHENDPNWAISKLEQHYDSTRDGVINHVQGVPPVGYDRFAKGFDHFQNEGAKSAAWLGGIGILLLAVAFARTAQSRRIILAAAAATSIVQLGIHGASFTRGSANLAGQDSPIHAFLHKQAVESNSLGGFAIVRASKMPSLPTQLPPGQLMHRGIRDLNFYSHADARTLVPLRMLIDQYHEQLGLTADDGERIAGKGYLTQSLPADLLRHPFFDLLGVRYALATEADLDRPPYAVGDLVGPQLRGRGGLFIYERKKAVPRIYMSQSIEVLPDDAAVLKAITRESLEPRRQAYVVDSDLPTNHQILPPKVDHKRDITITRNNPTQLELRITKGERGYVVITDTFLPGWEATIDGKPTEIIRCNHSQKLIALPEQACLVTITYEAEGLALGLMLAILAALIAITTWTLTSIRQRRAQPSH